MRTALLIVLAALTFLAAAKAHGRQVRLERERAGFTHVVFGGSNPPFVEALWRRERSRYWSIAGALFALLAAAVAVARWTGRELPLDASAPIALLAAAVVALIVAFVISGGWSLAALVRAGPPPGAVLGSAFWWSLVAALTTATVAAARTT